MLTAPPFAQSLLACLLAATPGPAGVDGPVYALAAGDAGLYVAGSFGSAGGVTARNIALWDGAAWRPLGTGVDGPVFAIHIDGSNVYVGGAFDAAGGQPAAHVAVWDGASWSGVGGGVAGPASTVKALSRDAAGLLVGGIFAQVGASTPANGLARWTGTAWDVLGGIPPGIEHDIRAIAPLGGTLYVGGVLRFPGSTRPDEATLSRATPLVLSNHAGSASATDECAGCGSVDALATSGADLYAAGAFTRLGQTTVIGSPYAVVRLASATVSVGLGDGTMLPAVQQGGAVHTILAAADGIYAGGNFVEMRGVATGYIARWESGAWTSPGGGLSAPVRALAGWRGSVYAGGDFVTSGGVIFNHVACWDGAAWQALEGSPVPVKERSWGAVKSLFR